MCELDPASFGKVRHLFGDLDQYVPVFAVIERRFPGRVFADREDDPTTAVVWAVTRWAYVEGDSGNRPFLKSMDALIRETVVPVQGKLASDWFELYAPNDARWMSAVEESLSAFKPERHFEQVYTLDASAYRAGAGGRTLPGGARIERIDVPILPDAARGVGFIADEFASRSTFGFQLVVDDRPVAACRSIGFESGSRFMVYVVTHDEGDRGKGYATLAGAALVGHSLEHGYDPLWETTEWNLASQAVARKLGYVGRDVYPVYGMSFK
jgi:hypothetical protein